MLGFCQTTLASCFESRARKHRETRSGKLLDSFWVIPEILFTTCSQSTFQRLSLSCCSGVSCRLSGDKFTIFRARVGEESRMFYFVTAQVCLLSVWRHGIFLVVVSRSGKVPRAWMCARALGLFYRKSVSLSGWATRIQQNLAGFAQFWTVQSRVLENRALL